MSALHLQEQNRSHKDNHDGNGQADQVRWMGMMLVEHHHGWIFYRSQRCWAIDTEQRHKSSGANCQENKIPNSHARTLGPVRLAFNTGSPPNHANARSTVLVQFDLWLWCQWSQTGLTGGCRSK